MEPRPEISVVVPLHNEAQNVGRLVDELRTALASITERFELVLVDDGSRDGTVGALAEIARQDSRVQPVHLSRNFGKESALAAGLGVARGDAVIVMDGDLQHPPSVLPDLVARWRDGADIVNAVKSDRGKEGVVYGALAKTFYLLIGGAIGQQMRGQSDYKLLDRQVVDRLNEFGEQHRFFRGLVAWMGFRVDEVPFVVAPRAGGQASWTRLRLFRYALRNLMSFSSLPLQAIAWLGFVTTGLAALLAVQTFYNWATGGAVDGFTTAILVTLIMGGVNLVCLGIVAIYQSVMYDELKGRPGFIIRKDRERVDAADASITRRGAE